MASIDRITTAAGEVRYRARWRTPGGGSRSKRFEQRRDAVAHLAAVETAKAGGDYVNRRDGRVTLAAYAATWAEGRLWRPSSRIKIEGAVRTHILPDFGRRELRSLRPSELQAWVRHLSEDRAPATVRLAAWAIKSILAAASADRIIPHNPAAGLRLPQPVPRKVIPLTASQVADLVEAMPLRYRTVVLVSAATGLRIGELLGLTLEALDPDAGLLRVERQLVELRGRPVTFGPLKTKASARELPIPESVVEVVLGQVADYGEGPEGAIFTTHRGGLVGPKRFRPVFDNAVQVAGLPARTVPHDLRHTFASVLLDAGCSVKELQERLGHASAKVTLDTYAHLMPAAEHRTREAIAENLSRIVSLSCPPGVRAAA